MKKLLTSLLSIPSPTYKEDQITHFILDYAKDHFPSYQCYQNGHSFILDFSRESARPHIALVAHTDVVPGFFEPYEKEGLVYGAGASDMKAGLASFMAFMTDHHEVVDDVNLSLIIYAKEEGTPLEENGLHDLISHYPNFFKKVDVAIVGEPTSNEVQIGCVGSLHAKVMIKGQSCHSARPWQGENALYKALPFVDYMAKLQPEPVDILGVRFQDVFQITESHSEKGRTSVPGFWQCNVNYRFSPDKSMTEAESILKHHFKQAGIFERDYEIVDCVPAGEVIESALFKKVLHGLSRPLQAKQAWTDVAQFSLLGIPAFNFGPGLPEQAHQENEYVPMKLVTEHYDLLQSLFKLKMKGD